MFVGGWKVELFFQTKRARNQRLKLRGLTVSGLKNITNIFMVAS